MPIASTIDAIRSGIVTAVRGITPTYTPYASELWRPVRQQKDVPSVGVRSFFVEIGVPIEEGEIFGGCALHTADLSIWTSYGDMLSADAQSLIGRDNQDLWRELHRAQIDGAPKFEKGGFDEQDDDGRLWGAHVFIAHLFLPLPWP